MSLLVPTVGQEASPTWAQDINASLSIIDQHNHANGAGVPITPSGLEISADLPFLNNNAIDIRSARFIPQPSPLSLGSDIGCVYVSGVDLYYNDVNGNQIQITALGGIAGTPGSIGGLVAPASVTYVGATPAFVFQSNANVSADLDAGSVTIRENVAAANGVKLSSPTVLGASYTLTLLSSLPGTTLPVSVSSSGNLSAAQITSAQLSSNLALSGNVTVSGNLTAATGLIATAGNITASAGNLVTSVGNLSIAGTSLLSGLVTASVGLTATTGDITVTAGSLKANTITPASGTTLNIDPVSIISAPANTSWYLGSASSAFIRAAGTRTLDIYTAGTSTARPAVVSANPSSHGLMIVRGVVTAAGAVQGGEGFSVSHPSAGEYIITFSTPFADTPMVVATPKYLGAALPFTIGWGTLNTTTVQIYITNAQTNVNTNNEFCFEVIGQRGA